MPKIYLSPAYHYFNKCAVSGCDETTHNNKYLDALEPFLKACGIQYKRGTRRVPKSSEDGTALMNKAIKESNAYKPDIHYVSHTNAFNGTVRGCRPMIRPNSKKSETLAKILMQRRAEIYNQPITLTRTTEWAELRLTTAPAAYYEEHVFHDSKADAKWFHDNLENVARQTAKGFCDYFCIKFVEPSLKGDVNGDGAVDMKDVQTLRKHLSGEKVSINKKNADVNSDGKVDMKDVLALRKQVAGVDSKKSIDELAREVIAGKYGNGEERKKALGDMYAAVQARVNELLS